MALGIAHLLLMPNAWASSLSALLFFPLVIGGLLARQRTGIDAMGTTKSLWQAPGRPGRSRRVACDSAVGIDDRDAGVIPERENGTSGAFLVVLPAVVAVAIDIFSARLERRAEKEQD